MIVSGERTLTYLALANEFGSCSAAAVAILRHFPSPEKIWEESPFSLGFKLGAKPEKLHFLERKAELFRLAHEQIQLAAQYGAEIITPADECYPDSLRVLYDPPLVLYTLGDSRLLKYGGFALVGTRKPTPAGIASAYHIAKLVGEAGYMVVSGAARGIDTAAHKGVLDAGGKTIAVLGNGLGYVYPKENRTLYRKIAENGVLVSEFPIKARPQRFFFPQRNRLIAALSRAVVVVQAPCRSGALITADFALEQGKDVYASPWNSDVEQGLGCLALLCDGANVVVTGEELLGLPVSCDYSALPERAAHELSEQEQYLLKQLNYEKKTVIELAFLISLPVYQAAAMLMKLVLKGFVNCWNGDYYSRSL